MTDRSEISTDRSDYNGSMGYFDENPGLGNGDISPRGAGLPAANIGLYGGAPERGGGGASPHARLMSWVGDSSAPSYPDTMGGGNQGTVGGQGQGQGVDMGDVPQDILKRARPAHPRFDEFDNTWRRGVSNPKNKDKDKEDSKTGAVTLDASGESNGATNEVNN